MAAKRAVGSEEDKPLTEKESQAAIQNYAKVLRETKRRRGICFEMLSMVGEGNGESCSLSPQALACVWEERADLTP